MEKLPKQNDKPKIVFIIGAGASYADGVPLQRDIIPKLLFDKDIQLRKSDVSKKIKRFIKQNFSCKDQFPSLEEVFGFIDFFINNEISLSKEWNKQELICIKKDLMKVLHYVISMSAKRSDNFSRFWVSIKENNPEVGIITTNYDTLIDDSFDKIYPVCLLDYCIDLANFRYPNVITPFDWWVDPKKPTDIFTKCEPTKIKLIKIHGSLNWKYCDSCDQVALTPWQHGINLKRDTYESFLDTQISSCPFDENKLSSLIQVPTHLKSNNIYIFRKLYDEAAYLIKNATRLVFIGYSFPEADVHIRALIKRCFSNKGKIIVVNKSRAKDLKHRYESLARCVQYHEMTFESFVSSKLFRSLLTAK